MAVDGEGRGPYWLSGGRHPADIPTPLYLFIPCSPETLGVEEGQRVGRIPLTPPTTWSLKAIEGYKYSRIWESRSGLKSYLCQLLAL